MKPRPGNEPESLEGLQNRHLDELWELEMAEEAHDRAHDTGEPGGGRLQHYLHALNRHYERRTPQDLLAGELAETAHYLRQRYNRLVSRVRRMISPGGPRRDAAFACASHNTAWRVHLKSACDAHDAFVHETRELIRYWTWVRSHQRLPGRLAFRLNTFNTRPIAYPWTSIPEPVMQTIARLDTEIHQHGSHITRGGLP